MALFSLSKKNTNLSKRLKIGRFSHNEKNLGQKSVNFTNFSWSPALWIQLG